MNIGRSLRSGWALSIVLVVMTVVGGLLTLVAVGGAERHRSRQADRVRLVAQAIADSAAVGARTHLDTWSSTASEGPIELDVEQLLPAGITGSATVTVRTVEDRKVCRLSVRVARGAYVATEEMELN